MKFISRCMYLASFLTITLAVAACGENESEVKVGSVESPSVEKPQASTNLNASKPATEQSGYDRNSWKTMIPDNCKSFFDGCNHCRRSDDSDMAMCTKKMCMEYQRPKCFDELGGEGDSATSSSTKDAPAIYEIVCDNGKFKLFFNEYVADDQRLKLQKGQVMLSDAQAHETSLLVREATDTGEKYSNPYVELRIDGEIVEIKTRDGIQYNNCKKV